VARAAIGSRLVSHHVFFPFGLRERGDAAAALPKRAPSKYFTFKRLIWDLFVKKRAPDMCVREVHKHAALILSRSRWKISAFEAIFRETRLRARGAGKAKSHCANTCGIIFFVRDTNSFYFISV
jgi:hypothetical protein